MMRDNEDYRLLSKKEKKEYDEQIIQVAESTLSMFEAGFDIDTEDEDNEE